MTEMSIARVYDTHDADGRAAIGADRERLTDPAERAELARYLRGCRMVLGTTSRERDRLEPERGDVVPLSFRTDGTWVWSEALAYYIEVHGLAPEPALRRHLAARGYKIPDVPDEVAHRASGAVLPG